jgi:hypothetical protein
MESGGSSTGEGRGLLLVWDVSAEQEEPWRRFLQKLSDSPNHEDYAQSRRALDITTESVWLPPKLSGGGVTTVHVEAEDPERVVGELAASDTPFDSWYATQIHRLFGLDVARLERVAAGKLLFAWRDDDAGSESEVPNNS